MRRLDYTGGESTVMSKMLDYNNLRQTLIDLKDKINIMGICAGMVLLSSTKGYVNLDTLSIMNFNVKRNGFGRQIHSFKSNISFLPIIIVSRFLLLERQK